MRICFLVSGGGGNLRFIYRAIALLKLNWEIIAVIGDRSCGALDFARNEELFCEEIIYTSKNDSKLNELLQKISPDLIITNIHKILSSSTLNCLSESRFINLHYSLLPAYSGLINMAPLYSAHKANNKFIGVTTHYVNEVLDGGEIISQAVVSPDWNDIPKLEQLLFKMGALTLFGSIISIEGSQGLDNSHCMISGKNVWFAHYSDYFETLNTDLFWSSI